MGYRRLARYKTMLHTRRPAASHNFSTLILKWLKCIQLTLRTLNSELSPRWITCLLLLRINLNCNINSKSQWLAYLSLNKTITMKLVAVITYLWLILWLRLFPGSRLYRSSQIQKCCHRHAMLNYQPIYKRLRLLQAFKSVIFTCLHDLWNYKDILNNRRTCALPQE